MKENCEQCKHFNTCDNMGTYETCMPSYLLFELDLTKATDLDFVCQVAESNNLQEEDKKALLAREDVDTDYSDMYFHPMCEYGTIREAIAYNEQETYE